MPKHLPTISILIAIRNEEANIIQCLHSIENLDYPKDNLQILLGNDQSTDLTEELVQEFIIEKPHYQLINIKHKLLHLQGKANVLAQLAHHATGEYLAITDADIEVPKNWLQHLLTHFQNPSMGIVTGVTAIKGERMIDKIQCIDWLFNIYWGHFFAQKKVPVTAMGNNMMVRASAYKAIGGYETIPFLVTEDFELFRNIVNKGYDFDNLFNPEVMAWSQPQETWLAVLKQRKRWMVGGFQLPWYLVLGIMGQYLFLPILLLLTYFQPVITLSFWAFQSVVHPIFIKNILKKVHYFPSWGSLIVFEIYFQISGVVFLLYYFFSGRVEWKGRVFNT